jgi:hypothetical protein
MVDAGLSLQAGLEGKPVKSSGPSSGHGASPDVSGLFCSALWWYFQPRSSIPDPFRDSFWFADFLQSRETNLSGF